MDITADATLLRRFATGRDDDAFAQILHRHADLVRGVCRRVAGSALAEDAFQSTFIALSRRAAALSSHPSIAGWLHHAALRISRGMRRQAARRQAREARVAAASPRVQEGGEPGTGQGDELDAAVCALPERYRIPVVLHYLEGMSLAEMSRRLGITEAALAQRLSRARRKLHRTLARAPEAALGAAAGAGACPAEALARAHELALHPQAAPAHLAQAAAFAAAPHRVRRPAGGHRPGRARRRPARSWSRRALPRHRRPQRLPRSRRQATPAAPSPPAPGTAAWATQEAYDSVTLNAYPLDAMWLAEGVRDAASDGRAPTDAWARIGSVADAPPAGDWAPARDRVEGWTAGVPRVGPGAALWGPADGRGLTGVRPGRHCCIFISEVGSEEAVIAPLHVAGGGLEWVVAIDRWDDRQVKQLRPLRRHVLLVDLGSLPPGRITLRLVERRFASDAGLDAGLNDYHWAGTAFATAIVEVGDASAPAIVLRKDLGLADGLGFARSERTPRLERSALVPWSPGEGGVTEPLASWTGFMPLGEALALLARPRLPETLAVLPLAGIAQPALVIVGPALPSGGHLWVYDHMSLASHPGFRAQWWLSFDEAGPAARRVIVVPLPARAPRAAAPEQGGAYWEVGARGTAYAITTLEGYGRSVGDGWQACMLTDEVKLAIKQQLHARQRQPATRAF